MVWEWLSGGGGDGGSGGGGNFKHVSPMFTFHGFRVFQIPLSMTGWVPPPLPLPTCKLLYGSVFARRFTRQRTCPSLKHQTLHATLALSPARNSRNSARCERNARGGFFLGPSSEAERSTRGERRRCTGEPLKGNFLRK